MAGVLVGATCSCTQPAVSVGPELAHLVRNVRRATRPGLMKGFIGRCRAVFRCSLVAVAAAGLLLPQGFSRCCPQPGNRSGCDQG
jgi:hypothetical protein